MADHLQHGATDTQGIHSSDAEQHKSHVTDRAAGDPAFDVVLGKGVQSAVNDVDDPEDHQGGARVRWASGSISHVEAQQGIAAHLQQHPGEQHRDRCIGFAVGIRQPGVQREHRQFDAEADQESQVTEQAEAPPADRAVRSLRLSVNWSPERARARPLTRISREARAV